MAIREVIDCDICGQKDCGDEVELFQFFKETVTTAAGDVDDVYNEYHVCSKCQTYWLKRIQKNTEKTHPGSSKTLEEILIILKEDINEKFKRTF